MKSTPYEKVTERILKLMEEGVCPWKRPWNRSCLRAQNFLSRNEYRGINLFLLEAMAFESPYFLTFKQSKELGGTVKKGEKGLPVVYWGQKQMENENDPDVETKRIRFLRSYTVFNARQIDGIEFPAQAIPESVEFSPIEKATAIIEGWRTGPAIEHGFRAAAYCPTSDRVTMPSPESFHGAEEYYSTLFHELGHATGIQKRLNRDMTGFFGSQSYGREELVAEMASAFLCAKCGIDNSVIENQAAYLDGWTRAIKSDSRLVVIAAAQASKAAAMITGAESIY